MNEAFEEGRRAFWKGESKLDNPYRGLDEDEKWDAWLEGWYTALEDE